MTKTITIYHSPDADDAFMMYGIVSGNVARDGYIFQQAFGDIESLNQKAIAGRVDVSAVSVHAYAHLGGHYLILPYGASMGGSQYGPRLVATEARPLSSRARPRIGIPGTYTSAALALRIYLMKEQIDAELIPMHFDEVQSAVAAKEVEAGLIIHEGQITHERHGLHALLDLGVWWWSTNALPLPLGINVIRKELGSEVIKEVSAVIGESISYSLAHRSEALQYALSFGRGISSVDADRFVSMYVNEISCDLGAIGRSAIQRFLDEAQRCGFITTEGASVQFL